MKKKSSIQSIPPSEKAGLSAQWVRPDLDRRKRLGFPEVIYGEGKTAPQIVAIAQNLVTEKNQALCNILVTRVHDVEELSQEYQKNLKGLSRGSSSLKIQTPVPSSSDSLRVNARARTAILHYDETYSALKLSSKDPETFIATVCAGTTDLFVVEECEETLVAMGIPFRRFSDVGVAGIHRLLACQEDLKKASVLIVFAGMEGALPSVVGGLFSQPLIAVPTSVGYGVSAGGMAALHSMLSSCAPGITVVNIDNGFGAAFAAFRILKSKV